MTKNMGTVDRVLRTILAVVFFALCLLVKLPVALMLILVVLGFVFLATSAFSYCPLYVPLKLTTRRER